MKHEVTQSEPEESPPFGLASWTMHDLLERGSCRKSVVLGCCIHAIYQHRTTVEPQLQGVRERFVSARPGEQAHCGAVSAKDMVR